MGFADYAQVKSATDSQLHLIEKKSTARNAENYKDETGTLRTSYSDDKSVTIFSIDKDNNGVYESEFTCEETPDGGVRPLGDEHYYNDTGNIKDRTVYDEYGQPYSKTMYDEEGKVTEFQTYDKEGNSQVKQFEYYNDGTLKSTTTVGADGKKETVYQDSFMTRLFKR